MTDINRLVEQHIREYEAHRDHIEALMAKAHDRISEAPEHRELRTQLDALTAERDKLVVRLDEFRLKSVENWREEEIERSSLMGVWDALAQQLERLVERLER